MADHVTFERSAGTAWIRLARPEKRNAMTSAMARHMADMLAEAAADDSIRVVVLAGSGGSFSAGLDRDEIRSGLDRQRSEFPVEALVLHPKPTIAAVCGPAHGGGATMAMACDLRVGGVSASFTFGLGKVGLTPEWGSSYLLWRQIGWSRALDLFLTGRSVDSGEAARLGLLDRVVPDADVDTAAAELAGVIASVPAGTAEATKEVLRRGLEDSFEECRALEKATLARRARALRDLGSGPA